MVGVLCHVLETLVICGYVCVCVCERELVKSNVGYIP